MIPKINTSEDFEVGKFKARTLTRRVHHDTQENRITKPPYQNKPIYINATLHSFSTWSHKHHKFYMSSDTSENDTLK